MVLKHVCKPGADVRAVSLASGTGPLRRRLLSRTLLFRVYPVHAPPTLFVQSTDELFSQFKGFIWVVFF